MSVNAESGPAAGRAHRRRARAWWSLALLPVSLALAFVIGEGLGVLLGTSGDASAAPAWVMGTALAVAVLVFAAPLVLTWHYGKQAAAARENGPWVPLIVGAVLVGGFAIVNVASGLLVVLAP